MEARIRFLHLSDIHYLVGADAEHTRRILLNGLRSFFKKNERVHCLVLTGDFLNQGKFNSDLQSIVTFTEDVCKISLLSDRIGDWKKHVFFCPGNHDAYRNASYQHDDGKGTYEVFSRADALKKVTSSPASSNRMVSNSSKEHKLLASESFWLFNHAVCPEISSDVTDYGEYHLFSEDVLYGDSDCARFFFVGINTALYAGQIRETNEIKEDLARKRGDLFEREKKGFPDYKEAKKSYEEYLRYYKELVHAEANDSGKLCFISQESEEKLRSEIEEKSKDVFPVFVFFGHHPLEWLTDEARKSFADFANNYSTTPLYLCGHEHKPRARTVVVNFTSDIMSVRELEVGGDFPDESGWNVLSFSVDTLTVPLEPGSNKVKLTGCIGCWRDLIERKAVQFMKAGAKESEWTLIDFETDLSSPENLSETSDEIESKDPKNETNFDNIVKKEDPPPSSTKIEVKPKIKITNDILN